MKVCPFRERVIKTFQRKNKWDLWAEAPGKFEAIWKEKGNNLTIHASIQTMPYNISKQAGRVGLGCKASLYQQDG